MSAKASATSDDTVEAMLADQSETARALARAIRNLVHELDPDVVEVPWREQGVVGLGIGPRKFTEHYAYWRFTAST